MGDTRASEFFHGYAHDFDAIYGGREHMLNRAVNRYLRKSMRLRYEKTLAGCQPIEGRTVLDIGCGPGHYAVALAEMGAARVVGLDFADEMVRIAEARARETGVLDRCTFLKGDFLTHPLDGPYDYAIAMGFMDYIEDPRKVIDRAISLVKSRVFFSFPAEGGFLAWQRKVRYQSRCPLYLYSHQRIEGLFEHLPGTAKVSIEPIARDYFVTVQL